MNQVKVLQISQFDTVGNDTAFYANRISDHLVSSHKHIERPHKHDFYAVLLFTAGTGTHSIDFVTYDVNPGSLFIMSPGQTHYWELSADTDGYIFCHTQDFFDLQYIHLSVRDFPFFSSVRPRNFFSLEGIHKKNMESLFANVLSEYVNPQRFSAYLLVSLLVQVYIGVSRLPGLAENDNTHHVGAYYNTLVKFEKLLEQHFTTQKSAAKYAEWLNITPKHLNRINLALLNKTTSEIIAERVILEAKRLLLYSPNSFSQIALHLGYEDYAYFSRLFKSKTGQTPTAFRKKFD